MNNNYCVIMSGGIGSRFWPASRSSYPKQFLDFFGTGRSLIQQTFYNMRVSGKQFNTAEVPMLQVRSTEDMLLTFGSAIIRALATTPEEYADIVRNCLQDTHFVFDPDLYAATDAVLSLSWTRWL